MSTCPHCGYENATEGTCPLCGTATAGAGTQPARVATASFPDRRLPEWEDPEHGFPRNLFDTWRRSMFEPTAFFEGVPYDRPATRPILYYLIVSLIAALFGLWWNAVFATAQLGFMSDFMAGLDLEGASGSVAGNALLNFFIAPFAAVIGLIVWTLILHVLVFMFAKQRRGLSATARVISYATGPMIFSIVPMIGGLIGWVWSIALTVIGVRAAHRTSTGAAATIVLIPIVLSFALAVALIVVLVAAIASMGL